MLWTIQMSAYIEWLVLKLVRDRVLEKYILSEERIF